MNYPECYGSQYNTAVKKQTAQKQNIEIVRGMS